jgi:hypothetical protein
VYSEKGDWEGSGGDISQGIKSFLCLTKHHAMKMFRRSGVIAPHILNVDCNNS